MLTGKKKLFKNQCIIWEEKSLRKLFNYETRIGEHCLAFAQNGDKFDLRIDNESFIYMYNRLRQSDHFSYEGPDGRPEPQ